jgi:hypothetical protein
MKVENELREREGQRQFQLEKWRLLNKK